MGDPVFTSKNGLLMCGKVVFTVYKEKYSWLIGNIFRIDTDGDEVWVNCVDVPQEPNSETIGYFAIRDNGILRKDCG